jgi:UrcA family protein
MNFHSASVALLWTTAMGLTVPAAVGSQETASTRISLRDVDLTTPSGNAIAAARIVSAARRLCARFRNSSRIDDAETFAVCVHDASVDALVRVQKLEQSR